MRSVQSIDKHQRAHHRDGQVVLCGHSAGAHLAVELALRKDQLPTPSVAGVIAISGIFELQPLITTTLNERLKLDRIKAQAYSPLFRVSKALAPALFIVGESETLAFHMQSQEMALQWKIHGNSSEFQLIQDADHFLVLEKMMGKAGFFNNFCNEFLLRA
jgi:arylformamidase